MANKSGIQGLVNCGFLPLCHKVIASLRGSEESEMAETSFAPMPWRLSTVWSVVYPPIVPTSQRRFTYTISYLLVLPNVSMNNSVMKKHFKFSSLSKLVFSPTKSFLSNRFVLLLFISLFSSIQVSMLTSWPWTICIYVVTF